MSTSRGMSLVSIVLSALFAACTPLPAGWRDAAAVEGFTQSECTGRASELRRRPGERIAAQASGNGRLRLEYRDAHFRCQQRVRGYAKVADGRVDVLVQPVDMNPSSVTKCDCLYDIRLEVPGLAPGTYDVTLHRRTDNWGGPSQLVRVARARVAVP